MERLERKIGKLVLEVLASAIVIGLLLGTLYLIGLLFQWAEQNTFTMFIYFFVGGIIIAKLFKEYLD